MENRSNRQGGWLASFVIVGAVLVLALLGTAYFIKRQNSNPTPTSEPVPADNSSKSSEPTNQAPVTEKNNSETPEKVDTNKDQSASSDKEKTSQPNKTPTSGKSANPLPTTGPEDIPFRALVLLIVSFTVVSYVRSRRPHFDIS